MIQAQWDIDKMHDLIQCSAAIFTYSLLGTLPPEKRNPVHSIALYLPDFQGLSWDMGLKNRTEF